MSDKENPMMSRRRALARLGGLTLAAYAVPAFATLSIAQAGSGSDDGDSGKASKVSKPSAPSKSNDDDNDSGPSKSNDDDDNGPSGPSNSNDDDDSTGGSSGGSSGGGSGVVTEADCATAGGVWDATNNICTL